MQVNSKLRVFDEPCIACALWRKLKTTMFLVRESQEDMGKKFKRIRSALDQYIVSIQFSNCQSCLFSFSCISVYYAIYGELSIAAHLTAPCGVADATMLLLVGHQFHHDVESTIGGTRQFVLGPSFNAMVVGHYLPAKPGFQFGLGAAQIFVLLLLDQQLPPARDGSATLLYATADEPSLVAGKRHRRLASRSLEKSSCCQVRGFGNTSSRFLKTD
jgi:hypothetical protein